MNYAYCRCSTQSRDLDVQKYEILKYADNKNIKINHWEQETISSRKHLSERKLSGLIERLKTGDTLIVAELSRLGRSLTEVMSILHNLMERKVKVLTIKEGYELGDNLNSKILAFAFSLASEVERQMISLRTREALSKIKSEGRKLGRPTGKLSETTKLSGKEEQIKEFLAKKVSKSAIAKILGVSRGTVINFVKSRKLETA